MAENQIISPSGQTYKVRRQIGATDRFKLYECLLADGRICILKIASSVEQNSLLDREAYILGIMREEAKSLEAEYALIKTGNEVLNYQFFFPDLIESFVAKDQNNRRINILSFFEIAESLGQLAPLSHLISRDHVRVDPRTSAWILGKLLKLLVFTHSQGISVGFFTGENILINRERHFVAVFDWTKAMVSESGVASELAREEISQAAREVIVILGGNANTGELLFDEQLTDSRYADFLKDLLFKRQSSAEGAHRSFYELILALWPRKFYPFTTYRN